MHVSAFAWGAAAGIGLEVLLMLIPVRWPDMPHSLVETGMVIAVVPILAWIISLTWGHKMYPAWTMGLFAVLFAVGAIWYYFAHRSDTPAQSPAAAARGGPEPTLAFRPSLVRIGSGAEDIMFIDPINADPSNSGQFDIEGKRVSVKGYINNPSLTGADIAEIRRAREVIPEVLDPALAALSPEALRESTHEYTEAVRRMEASYDADMRAKVGDMTAQKTVFEEKNRIFQRDHKKKGLALRNTLLCKLKQPLTSELSNRTFILESDSRFIAGAHPLTVMADTLDGLAAHLQPEVR